MAINNKSLPSSPTDGQVVENSPGIFYRYSAITRSWCRITTPVIPLATPILDGLMSSDDYIRLTGMILPPPQVVLTAQDCAQTFSEGLVEFRGDGIISATVKPDNLTENVGAVDFSLDLEAFVAKFKQLGKYRATAPAGDQGDQGEPGDPGLDALQVGPYGTDGADGANAPWSGSLIEDDLEIIDDNRVVVDVSTLSVSESENYIVVTRANVGNPDACPDNIIPLDVQSPWLLSFASAPLTPRRTVVDGNVVCSWACSSDLFYFNIESLVLSIGHQYTKYLTAVKAQKESSVGIWLSTLIDLFDEQKGALCCALEACRSRSRNVAARQYIEDARITAFNSNARVLIGARGDNVVPGFYQKCQNNIVRLLDPEVIVK